MDNGGDSNMDNGGDVDNNPYGMDSDDGIGRHDMDMLHN